jgi:hypothetical protein
MPNASAERMTPRWPLLIAIAVGVGSCAPTLQHVSTDKRLNIAELWQAPVDLERRNLFYGPGGREMTPRTDAPFQFVEADVKGISPGYDVRDKDGTEWSVKLGNEVQPEIVVSRLLWAIGFHQPPTYYVASWHLTGYPGPDPQPAARFRPNQQDRHVVSGWDWYRNPYLATREFKGLVVANLMVNNWDLKTTNNKLYVLDRPVDGVTRWFVVRDLGASLGKTSMPFMYRWLGWRHRSGSKNEVADFEGQQFIKRVHGDDVDFDYLGLDGALVNRLHVEDVRWTCELLARLSDAQLDDAFRAAGYDADHRARYARKIKEKIAQGLSMAH